MRCAPFSGGCLLKGGGRHAVLSAAPWIHTRRLLPTSLKKCYLQASVNSADIDVDDQTQTLENVLDNLRRVQGVANLEPGVEAVVSGRGKHLGIGVHWTLRWTSSGCFMEEIRGPQLTFKWGYDGRADSGCWEVDSSGLVRVMECDDHEAVLMSTYLRTGCWLLPHLRERFDIELLQTPPLVGSGSNGSSATGDSTEGAAAKSGTAGSTNSSSSNSSMSTVTVNLAGTAPSASSNSGEGAPGSGFGGAMTHGGRSGSSSRASGRPQTGAAAAAAAAAAGGDDSGGLASGAGPMERPGTAAEQQPGEEATGAVAGAPGAVSAASISAGEAGAVSPPTSGFSTASGAAGGSPGGGGNVVRSSSAGNGGAKPGVLTHGLARSTGHRAASPAAATPAAAAVAAGPVDAHPQAQAQARGLSEEVVAIGIRVRGRRLRVRALVRQRDWRLLAFDHRMCADVETWELGEWREWAPGVAYPSSAVHKASNGGQHAYLTHEGVAERPDGIAAAAATASISPAPSSARSTTAAANTGTAAAAAAAAAVQYASTPASALPGTHPTPVPVPTCFHLPLLPPIPADTTYNHGSTPSGPGSDRQDAAAAAAPGPGSVAAIAAASSSGSGGVWQQWVPVWRAASGHFLVRPVVNGQEGGGYFVLDTGASGFVITPQAAARLGGQSFGETHAASISGKVPARFVRLGSWALGGLSIRQPVLMVMDLEGLVRGAPGEVVGIVGYDLFRRSVVELPQMVGRRMAAGAGAGGSSGGAGPMSFPLGTGAGSGTDSGSEDEGLAAPLLPAAAWPPPAGPYGSSAGSSAAAAAAAPFGPPAPQPRSTQAFETAPSGAAARGGGSGQLLGAPLPAMGQPVGAAAAVSAPLRVTLDHPAAPGAAPGPSAEAGRRDRGDGTGPRGHGRGSGSDSARADGATSGGEARVPLASGSSSSSSDSSSTSSLGRRGSGCGGAESSKLDVSISLDAGRWNNSSSENSSSSSSSNSNKGSSSSSSRNGGGTDGAGRNALSTASNSTSGNSDARSSASASSAGSAARQSNSSGNNSSGGGGSGVRRSQARSAAGRALRRAARAVPYTIHEMALHHPLEFGRNAAWVWHPLIMIANLPHVQLHFACPDGSTRSAVLMVDSGACGADIMLHARAQKELGLLAGGPKGAAGAGGGAGSSRTEGHYLRGVGQDPKDYVQLQVMDLPWAEVAGVRFEQVRCMCAAVGGLDISIYSHGILCGDMLARLDWAIDYTHKRIGFRPGAFSVPPVAPPTAR